MYLKNRNLSCPKAAFINVLLLLFASTLNAGQNLSNTWSQPAEHSISRAQVKNLSPQWVFTTGGDVSVTPTVDGDAVYFPDWAAISSRSRRAVANSSGLTKSPNTTVSTERSLGLVLQLITIIDYRRHSQFQTGAQRRERNLG